MLNFGCEPMLAKASPVLPPPSAGLRYEPKFDGYRALLYVGTDRVRVQSRRGADITDAFADVAGAAADQLPEGLVLDGELVVHDDGVLSFGALGRRMSSRRPVGPPASFVAFDVLCVGDVDARDQPFARRRDVLEAVLADCGPPLELVPQTRAREEAEDWMATYAHARLGLEGVVVKKEKSIYRPGHRGWVKVRVRDTLEAVVGAVTGSLAAPSRLVLGTFDTSGHLVMRGATGPLSTSTRRQVTPLLVPPTEEHPWQGRRSTRAGAWGSDPVPLVLTEPSLVVEVSVDTAVDDGRWRHQAAFVRVRPDLSPAEL